MVCLKAMTPLHPRNLLAYQANGQNEYNDLSYEKTCYNYLTQKVTPVMINWPHHESARVAHRLNDTDKLAVFETGYGPSGLPHIGTFAEVVRTSYVIKAFRATYPHRPTRLIVFSDDMDGLRSLPENVPNHALLKEYLGAPLSSLPDPFEKESSYAAFMNGRLKHFLDYYGFEYLFESATNCYQTGVFNTALQRVMDNHQAIRNLFIKTIAPDKRDAWSPFFPICERCGKIYTTSVVATHPESYEITYHCDRDDKAYRSCGHQGRTSILDGKVKVGWKVDWAMRWYAFGVDYEMHGKDLLDSASLSSKICALLGAAPPLTYKYELFLDENGAKISKKIGNGVSMEQWQRFAPVGSLLYFLLEEPNRARKMGLPILPRLVDNYITALKKEDAEEAGSALWFVDSLQNRHDASDISATDISYLLLINVTENLGSDDLELLYDYVRRYDPAVEKNSEFFRKLCRHALEYVKDTKARAPNVTSEPLPPGDFLPALRSLAEEIGGLAATGSFNADAIQNLVFAVGGKYELEAGVWFRFLYEALLGKAQGPRLGSFFAMLGFDRVAALLQKAMAPHEK
ncbi:Lysine--tRNA ligase [Gammaproteobacteria bacterium]